MSAMTPKTPPGSVVRKSWSRPDSSGGRKEIPLTASLESLSPSSADRPASCDKQNPGNARSRTPVGSAAPRRTGSANRGPAVPAPQHQNQLLEVHGSLPDDDSLVLYKDPSSISTQPSHVSVRSGRHQEGDTFFTALRRSYSYDSSGSGSDFMDGQEPAGGLSNVDSQLNPMQSPNTSAYFTTAGRDSEYASAVSGLQDEYSDAVSMAESSYATGLSQIGSTATGYSLAPTASVMDVINSLYGAKAAEPSKPQRKWQESDPDVQPLVPAGSAAVAHAEQGPQAEASAVSSVGSCDPAAFEKPHADEDFETLPQQQPLSAESTSAVVRASDRPEPEASSSFHSAEADNDDEEHLIDENSTTVSPQQQQEIAATGANVEVLGTANDDDDHAARQSASVYLTGVEGLLSKRAEVEADLNGFVQHITGTDGDGGGLGDVPADYKLMVERLLRERRAQYTALDGWEGPHRYDELPVSQLPSDHDDPKIAAGLAVIRQLDEKLREVWLKALVAAREAAPGEWVQTERQRLEKRAQQLEDGLTKERQKRLHAARLLRAFNKLEEGKEGPGLSSYSYYQLQPEEQQVLAAVLNRDDAVQEQQNPFDASGAVLDTNSMEELETLTAQLVQQSSRCLSAVTSSIDKGMSMLLSEYSAVGSAGAPEPVPAAEDSAAGSTTVGDANRPAGAASVAAAGVISYNRPSTADSSKSAGNTRPRHSLAQIDAMLQALQMGKQASDVQLQGAGPSRISASGKSRSSRSMKFADGRASKPSVSPSTKTATDMSRHGSSASARSQLDRSGNAAQQEQLEQELQQDYIREQREARELAQRDREIDARLRELRTSELLKPSAAQLQALLQECRQSLGVSSANGLTGMVSQQAQELGAVIS